MDQKIDPVIDLSTATATATVIATSDLFSKVLQSVSQRLTDSQRPIRRILEHTDPITHLTQSGLLRETIVKYLEKTPLPDKVLVLFMDRSGGGEGAKAAGTVIDLLAKRFAGVNFIHVSFVTPSRGLGTLLRSNLARRGSSVGVLTKTVAYNVAPEGLKISTEDANQLFANCDLAISFAPNGVAGITMGNDSMRDDVLLARSHISVLSFPDPEFAVADIAIQRDMLRSVNGIDAIRYWAQQKAGNTFDDLGHCILGPNGDAEQRLWVLLDNAKRGIYRLLIEPMLNGLPAGDPIVAPCKRLIEEDLSKGMEIIRIVSAGNLIITACRGKNARCVNVKAELER